MTLESSFFESSISNLIGELIDGPSDEFAFILGRGDPGLLATLDVLAAQAASQSGGGGGHSIAAHVNHMRFCLAVLNRWAGGDPNAFMEADWPSSWAVQEVTDGAWRALLTQLGVEARRWRERLEQPREWDAISLPGAIASVAHVAYHMGAIRQMAANCHG